MAFQRSVRLLPPAGFRTAALENLTGETRLAALAECRASTTFYDTGSLSLARHGVTLRHIAGEGPAHWILTFTNRSPRAEMHLRFDVEGQRRAVPSVAHDLVRAYVRSGALRRAGGVRTIRRWIGIDITEGRRLIEVVEYAITVIGEPHAGRSREIDVALLERSPIGRRAMAAAVNLLVAGGCGRKRPAGMVSRVLGPRTADPPDVVVPAIGPRAGLGRLVQHAIAGSVAKIISHDAGVRLGRDPEDVHQFRVATRRLRSDLRTFSGLLDDRAVIGLRDALAWLALAVGGVRDADVLAARLRACLHRLPEIDHATARTLMDKVEEQALERRAEMLTVLRTHRYDALIDELVAAASNPVVGSEAKERAATAGSKLVRRTWRRLKHAVETLETPPSDAALHHVRILAKRCRYAAEAVAPVVGKRALRFASEVADIQTVLGDHNDSVMAEAWLRSAASATPALAVVCGELITIGRADRARLLATWPGVWRAASAGEARHWLARR